MATLNVNGQVRSFEAEPDTPLLWVLREQLGLTGCVRPVSSVQATQKIVTIEGLSPAGTHAVQKAWVALDVPQCGFCQSGMIMAAAALLKAKPNPSDAEISEAITNICRCGTYNRVRAAIKAAAKGGEMKSAGLAIQHSDGSTT